MKHVEIDQATSHHGGGTKSPQTSLRVVAACQRDDLVPVVVQRADGGLAEVTRPTGDQNLHSALLRSPGVGL